MESDSVSSAISLVIEFDFEPNWNSEAIDDMQEVSELFDEIDCSISSVMITFNGMFNDSSFFFNRFSLEAFS